METRRRTGFLLVALGALFLVGQLGSGFAWPLLVMVPGVAMLAAAVLGPRSGSGLAVPGSIVTMVGLILLVQEWTHSYESWSYAWALILAAVGVGTFLQGAIDDLPERQREGMRLASTGLVLFAAFGVVFEFLVFESSLGGAGGWILPLLLIGGGVWMLRRGSRA